MDALRRERARDSTFSAESKSEMTLHFCYGAKYYKFRRDPNSVSGFKRNRVFLFRRYLNIFKDHRVDRYVSNESEQSEI